VSEDEGGLLETQRPDLFARRPGQNKHTMAAIAHRKDVSRRMLPLLDEMEDTFRKIDTKYVGAVLLQVQQMRELCLFWGEVPTTDIRSGDPFPPRKDEG
jgi:hypothetical protein